MAYPDNCIRGVANDSFIVKGELSPHLFYFRKEDIRPDGWSEQSINWEDDTDAIGFTLRQRKNKKIHYQIGIVIIPRSELDRIRDKYRNLNIFTYERKRTGRNKYHGNMLLNKDEIDKPLMKAIAGSLLTHADFRPRKTR
jgi:hypothetical protein